MKTRTQCYAQLLAACAILWSCAASADAGYFGATDTLVLDAPGCNSTAFVQLPGSTDLMIGRQLLPADGQLASLKGPSDCTGGAPGGQYSNRWSLTLDRMDWNTHTISRVKTLLDTSVDPQTRHPHTVITGGPMQGTVIQSAYDASVVAYRGQMLVAFECITEANPKSGVQGTSACLSVYDRERQALDLGRTQVIISGIHVGPTFYAASVPELLVFEDRLFLYWSSLAVNNGKFGSVIVRGAELEMSGGAISVKGSQGRLVHSTDLPLTIAVWGLNPDNPMSSNAIDIRALWPSGKSIIAMSSQGGTGCSAPSDVGKGCYRLVVVRASQPLGQGVFNHAQKVDEDQLPTNAQEYTRPIRDPEGHYWMIGHYLRPKTNGFSELRPVPSADVWQKTKGPAVLALFPLLDKSLWPTE